MVLLPRNIVYGEKNLVAHGPIASDAISRGKFIEVTFQYKGSGLVSKDSDVVKEIAVSSDGNTFEWAEAKLQGDKLMILNPEGKRIKKIRYTWSNNPVKANLSHKEGLPASPFQISVKY